MKKILIPVDFSELGDHAYNLASRIARPANAEIHILSVVQASPDVLFDHDGNVKDYGDQDLSKLYEEEKTLKTKMEEWVQGKDGISNSKVKIGRVIEDILNYVNENEIDLIVMGTEGAEGVEEIFRNSRAGQLTMQSPIPVLSLKCDRTDMKVNDLLLVFNFDKPEKLDLVIIKLLQKVFDARLNLLKVNTKSDFEPQREILLKMQQFVKLNELESVQYHVYSDLSVEQGIMNFSADTGIDFVTIGTHQRGELSRLFKKSVGKQIVNHIWQPVLTFPV